MDEPTRRTLPTSQADTQQVAAPGVAALLSDQRVRARRGEPDPVEVYLARHPHLAANPEGLRDLIANEVRLREERGEVPSLEEYRLRFPDLAGVLADLFEVPQDLDTVGDPPQPGAAAPAAPRRQADPNWPDIPGMEILAELGRGGMGVVYRARDEHRAAVVALKTMQNADPAALYRFKQEFRSLADVTHPNLVSLYEMASDGRTWYFTMELIEGRNFLEYVRSGPTSPTAAGTTAGETISITEAESSRSTWQVPDTEAEPLDLDPTAPAALPPRPSAPASGLVTPQRNRLRQALQQLAEGTAALHEAGKLHRDLKPSNVLVTGSGRVVLLDFGLIAARGREGQHQSTAEGIVGTAAYMAPEQAASEPIGPAADWYSVGVMLFESLTGRVPFVGTSLQILMDKQKYDPAPPVELVPDIPEDLNALCVDLLRRQPEKRPTGPEVLRRLGSVPVAASAMISHSSSSGSGLLLIGRDRHQRAMTEAFEAVARGGRTVILHVHGRSGMGKSTLIRRFLDDLEGSDAVVLAGRCYERESVPYKALDSLIDALSHYLRQLSRAEARELLPRDVHPLARVFPVLRRVEVVTEAPRRGFEVPDPQEVRRRAFSALRELLARLGDRRPLVLAIDDLQWGDEDSLVLLAELLRPPDPPPLLLLGSYRDEDAATSPFLQSFLSPRDSAGPALDRRDLAVEPLSAPEACDLVLALLDRDDSEATAQAEAIAEESGGNPFFVAELVRSLQAGDDPTGRTQAPAGTIALEEVLWGRIARLPAEARQLLEVVAVSGRPLRQTDAVSTLGKAGDGWAALALLRTGRLIRGSGSAEGDEIETYHDRVRETVVARLGPADLLDRHHRLARALEAAGGADPEVLGTHLQGAGERDRASEAFATAAVRAAEALAFDRAAKLYRLALELRPAEGAEGRTLRAALADALANAGRGAEAAPEYLAAAAGATLAEAFELRRRAAMQYLISGHIDQGLDALRTVLASVGMTLPGSPRRALLSLLLHRAQLKLRGLGFRPRDPSQVAAADLSRIDVCWSAGAGLSVVEPIRGADFQTRGLLLALRAGEPYRIARALTMEAAHSATAGGSSRLHTERLLEVADGLARQAGQPYASGMVALAGGVASYLQGRWRLAQDSCDRAEAIFRDRCTGVAWELDTAHAFALWALTHMGELADLGRRWPVLLQEARERGDLYAVMNLSTYLLSIARLAADDPEEARAEVRGMIARWSRQGYHVQHNDQVWAAVQIELYRGDGPAAWALLAEHWPALAGSLLLRVQFIRVSMRFLRARCALAVAVGSPRSASLLRTASREAARLEREKVAWADAFARLIRAGLADARGDRLAAADGYADAAGRFETVDMRLCAAVARRRRGERLGGTPGATLIAESDAWMTSQEIRNPARMAAMFAPAPSDGTEF